MSRFALRLLGPPEVTQDNEPVSGFRSAKARALLFYVAVRGGPESRTKLAGLLWGELPEANANANLRKTLTNLRQVAGRHLAISRETVALDAANPPWLDVCHFEEALDEGGRTELQRAVALYRGDFLDGFYLPQAPAFETWLLAERRRLREWFLAALKELAQAEAARGRVGIAIDHGRRLLRMEPLREDAHRLLMALLAQNGQRARALAQYEACAEILARELGVEPGAETTALFRQIRDGAFTAPPALAPRHNLPAATTSFVGREEELARIRRWLAEPNTRLRTILGPGGVGKTRLAHEAAWQAIDSFSDGVWSISLAALADVPAVATRMAATLSLTFFGRAAPEQQVVHHLRGKELLLLLDNAEHLLSQPFAVFLLQILTQAPGVQMMLTSRQRLTMQAEQVLHLPGLSFPDEADAAPPFYPAAQLFLQRSEGHGRALPQTAEVQQELHRLCRLVDGLPLALELAATWTPSMSLEQIVSAVERGIEILETPMRDIPPRQRSLNAVFDTSWAMLGAEEQKAMRQLAYFRGSFTAEAAADVAGVSPSHLQSLINQSLLRVQDNGCYGLHNLVRQYALARLKQHPGEAQAVARRHGRYFAAFLAAREEAIQGADYLRARDEIEDELDNVRQAWEWAVETGAQADIARSLETLHYFFLNTQGLFAKAAHRFEQAQAALAQGAGGETEPLQGRLLLKAAINQRMLGHLAEAGRLAQEALSLFYRHELAADIARAHSSLSVIRLQQNEKEDALRLAESAVQQARELDDPVDLCLCLNNLAYVLAHNGKVEAAVAVAEESAALAEAIDYPHGALSALNMLGVYYERLDEPQKAQALFERLVRRCRETGVRSRLAQAVNNLGALYKKRGDLERALPLLREAVSLYEALGQLHYAAFVRVMLGAVALQQGHLQPAQGHYRQALRTARELNMPALALNALALQARLLMAKDETEDAAWLLARIAQHPATRPDTRQEAQEALRALQETMPPHTLSAARRLGEEAGWDPLSEP